MEQIIARQNSAAKPATGKTFLLGIARIILELAIVQAIVNFLIQTTGIGLLNLLFYLYAVVLLVRFMTRTVAGTIYTLKEEKLELQRLLGDSTVLGVSIPLDSVLSIRPLARGEHLGLDYRRVTYVDPACAPGLRMRAAFAMSLVWAGLARLIAGKATWKQIGYVIAYLEEGKRCACAFTPDAAFLDALEKTLPDLFGADERLERDMLETYAAKSLRRAFGELYPHVTDAVSQEELAFEREEFARRKEERIAKRAEKKKMPLDAYKVELARKERKIRVQKRKAMRMLREAAEKIGLSIPKKQPRRKTAARETADTQEEAQTAPRRRRNKQE